MISLNRNLEPLKLSGIRYYTNLARSVPGCIMLTLGEPDFETPLPIRQAARSAMESSRTHYAPNQGVPELRQAIADYETGRGMPCTPEQILITQGATGALFTGLMGILNPGDEVIVPLPAFPLYESIITIAGAVPVWLPTAQDGFQISETRLNRAVTSKTKAIVLNSPNNPSGSVYTEASLTAVKKTAAERDFWIVCDNVYGQLAWDSCPDLTLDPSLQDRRLLCQSFSKPYAMTGWRIGYLAGPEETVARLLLLHAAQVASVPTFLQDACITALGTDITPMLEIYRQRRDFAVRRLKEMGLDFPEPKGAFYIFPDISRFGLEDSRFCTRLIREAAVAVVPGSCFGAPGHIRISYCCSMEKLRQGLDRLELFLHTLS